MLYKKYHRNRVRKFKKGSIIVYRDDEYCEVTIDPFFDKKEGVVIKINCFWWWRAIVLVNGKLKYTEAVRK